MVTINHINTKKFPMPDEEIKTLSAELNQLREKKGMLEHWERLRMIEIQVKLGKTY